MSFHMFRRDPTDIGVEVFAWKHGHGSPFGHAAISLIVGALDVNHGYISFHPASDSKATKLLGGPSKFKSRAEDLRTYERNETFQCVIYGLNVVRMDQFWRDFGAGKPDFSGRRVCSWLVHELLQAGGGNQYAGFWSSWILGQWSPGDVKNYAESIARNTSQPFGSIILENCLSWGVY